MAHLTRATFSALPRDVLCIVLTFITDVRDLKLLRLTCRCIRDCLAKAPLQLSLGPQLPDSYLRLATKAFPAAVSLALPSQHLRSMHFTDDALAALSPLTRLEQLDLSFACEFTSAGVKTIALFSRLTSLSLAGCMQLDDEALTALYGLSELRFLSLLFLERLTNKSVENMGQVFPLLEELHLGNCYKVSDAGLTSLPTSLRVLNLQFVAAGDAGLNFISRLTSLEYLNLYGCRRVGNASLAHFSALRKLKLLSLGDTSVNDEGLKHLFRIPNLRRLNLYALPGLTDSGLCSLSELTSLSVLDIEYCNITEEAAQILARACSRRWHLNLHGCRVSERFVAGLAKDGQVTSRCEMYCSWQRTRYINSRDPLTGMLIF